MKVIRMVQDFLYNDNGATLVEYALIVLFIVILCVLALTSIGTTVEQHFEDVNQGLK